MLNQINVGIVFTVDDHMSPKLETRANIYSHQTSIPKSRPGIIIRPFIKKAKNSTVLALVQ